MSGSLSFSRRAAIGLLAALTLAGAASPALAGGRHDSRGRDSGPRYVDRHDRGHDRRGRDYDRRDVRRNDRCEPRYQPRCAPPPRCDPPRRPRSGISVRIVIGG
jgi:hypothetical protein